MLKSYICRHHRKTTYEMSLLSERVNLPNFYRQITYDILKKTQRKYEIIPF